MEMQTRKIIRIRTEDERRREENMGVVIVIVFVLLFALLMGLGVGLGNNRFTNIRGKYRYEIPGNEANIFGFDDKKEKDLRNLGATDDEIMGIKHCKNAAITGIVVLVLYVIIVWIAIGINN